MDLSIEARGRAMNFMKSVARRSGEPFYAVSPAKGFRFVFVNDSACRHFGRSRKELLALGLPDVDPAFPPEAWPQFWKELQEQGSIFFETVHRNADGRDIPVAVSANLFAQERQELFGGCIHDLRREKETEAVVRESEKKFSLVFNQQFQFMAILSPEGVVLEINELPLRMTGYKRGDFLGKLFWQSPSWRDYPEWQRIWPERLAQAAQREGPVLTEDVYQTADGSTRSADAATTAVRDGEGKIRYFIIQAVDTTERRQALIEAEKARDKIAAIFESIGDGLLVTDLSDRVVLVNDAGQALLDTDLGASRQHIDSLAGTDDLQRQIVAVRRGEEEIAVTEWEKRSAGSENARVIQAQTTAVRNAQGHRTGAITILRDRTREREIDQMKNEFISTAAHELRTPLTTVFGFLQLLQNEGAFSPEEQKEFLRLALEKTEVLDRIISDLLDLSRVQAGKLISITKVRADLAALVRSAVGAYRPVTDRHTFEIDFPDEQMELCFDTHKIVQVLDNLLSNAVKFSPDGGRIQVIGHRTGRGFEIVVADEGVGMKAEETARMFDKFYRVDASNTAISGLGLGMSIAKTIVEAHGGRIWVESAPGRGTKVHFTLPTEEDRNDPGPVRGESK